MAEFTVRGNTNEELQEKAQLLENEKKQVEAKNIEIELARLAVEDKAEQIEVTSKYKSEFLANMSHELPSPRRPRCWQAGCEAMSA